MYIPNWGTQIITGNALVDEEHQQLFAKIDALMTAMSRNREEALIRETLDYLSEYAKKHFADEELLHREFEAPDYDAHVNAHRKIARELDDVELIYRNEGITPHLEMYLVNHVIRGIVDQIHEFDLPLTRYILDQSPKLSE